MFVNSSFVKEMNYNTIRLDTLKYLRDNINWGVKAKRHELFDEFYRVLNDWDGRLSDLQRIFRPEQIEILLSDTISRWRTEDNLLAPFISFLVQTGYKDKPKVDQDGKLIYRRCTPLSLAAFEGINPAIGRELFKIYDRFDINYTDERLDYTHLQVACEWGCTEVVEKFLEAGQDPNDLDPETGDSLLHLVLRFPPTSPEMIATLLRHGANPNVANKNGLTAVHLIGMGPEDSDLMQTLIDLTDHEHQPVRIHLRDKKGYTALQRAVSSGLKIVTETLLKNGAEPNSITRVSGSTPLHEVCVENDDVELAQILIKYGASIDAQDTHGDTPLHNAAEYSDLSLVEFLLRNGADPYITNEDGYDALQYAVASLRPDLIDVFFDNVVDLSSFVFPTAKQFNESNAHRDLCCRLELTSVLLIVVEGLEKRGRELARSDALTIMKFLTDLLLESTDVVESNWYDDEEFAIEAKKITVKPSLSLYDLTRLQYREAAKLLTHEDYLELWRSEKLWELPLEFRDDCVNHLCEKLARRFFRTWTLYPFWEKILHYRLPLLCSDMIMDWLTNKDLFNICLAAAK